MQTFGPTPLAFQPNIDPCTCKAFSLPFRALAVLIVSACGYWVFSLWSSGHLNSGTGRAAASGLNWALAALALLFYTLWCILFSRTTLTSTYLHQTFVWDKRLELRDLAYAKLLRVPGLDWLIAPRLYCRTMMGKFAVFYASDAQVIIEFERLRDVLKARNQA